MHRLLDCLTVLFAPITAAIDQEFGGRSVPTVDDTLPEPPPSADPMVVDATTVVASDVASAKAENPGLEAGLSAVEQPATTSATNEDVAFVEPVLYVRRGTRAYRPARPDDSGTHYRREVVGKRKTYTPVEMRR